MKVLIIVPPFASLDSPSLAAHILKGLANQLNVKLDVNYANIKLAAKIGIEQYESIIYSATIELLGEEIFSDSAYSKTRKNIDSSFSSTSSLDTKKIHEIKSEVADWLEEFINTTDISAYDVIGSSTTFVQTCSSVAILNKVKEKYPDKITIIGGANCDGEMAEAIVELSDKIDYVFSGECETIFPKFLIDISKNIYPSTKILKGEPCKNMDDIPFLDYKEYYDQLNNYLPFDNKEEIWLSYETSRGCWWGQKHHCTFCGLNGTGMEFRQKSVDRIIEELQQLLIDHPNKNISMADNIMPYNFFNTLIPLLPEKLPNLHMFYEQKANLTLKQLIALKKAGNNLIQPGIESLSTPLLKLMDKGVAARQNIDLLRYSRIVDIFLNWNLLYGFPNDKIEYYKETLALLPLLRHFNPPSGFVKLVLERFSPHSYNPDRFGIKNMRPCSNYYAIFPKDVSIDKLAYHFEGDYESESLSNPELMNKIKEEISLWRDVWSQESIAAPSLHLSQISDELFLLLDTRKLENTQSSIFLTVAKAHTLLISRPFEDTEDIHWAMENKLGIKLDNWFVPLPTVDIEVLEHFELSVSEKIDQTLTN